MGKSKKRPAEKMSMYEQTKALLIYIVLLALIE